MGWGSNRVRSGCTGHAVEPRHAWPLQAGASHFCCYARLRCKQVGEDEAITLGILGLPFDPQARRVVSPSRGKDHRDSYRAAELDPVISADDISVRADQGLP